jgi:hypothetical protein
MFRPYGPQQIKQCLHESIMVPRDKPGREQGDEQSSECRSGAKSWHYFAAEQPPS